MRVHDGAVSIARREAAASDVARPDRGEPGYTGEPGPAIAAMLADGVDAVAANGVVGDPTRSTADHGARYWKEVLAITLKEVT